MKWKILFLPNIDNNDANDAEKAYLNNNYNWFVHRLQSAKASF